MEASAPPAKPRSKYYALNDFFRDKSNEVTRYIAGELKAYLEKPLKENQELEIEAKIGVIMPTQEVLNGSDSFMSIFQTPHGMVMPEQKYKGKNLYYFTPGVPKDNFDLLIEIFSKESEKRDATIPPHLEGKERKFYEDEYCIKDLGEKSTIDRMFEGGVRKSFTKSNELIATIKKQKLKHINYFNKGKDYRISIAIEETVDGSDATKVINTRNKRRRSFRFKWLKFEFTETTEEDFYGKKAPSVYEIELEICDNKFFNQSNVDVYLRFVERFVSNIESLITAVAEGSDMYFDLYWKPELEDSYKELYEGDIMPVVGDYLATKAYLDKNT